MKITKEQRVRIKVHWIALEQAEREFSQRVLEIEQKMQEETGIKDIEFFACDGEYVGVGNDSRTMKLIHMR